MGVQTGKTFEGSYLKYENYKLAMSLNVCTKIVIEKNGNNINIHQ